MIVLQIFDQQHKVTKIQEFFKESAFSIGVFDMSKYSIQVGPDPIKVVGPIHNVSIVLFQFFWNQMTTKLD